MAGVVLRCVHQQPQCTRQDEAERQPVGQQADAPVKQRGGKLVRALRVPHLRKRRARVAHEIRLQIADADYGLDVDGVQPVENLLYARRIRDTLQIDDGKPGL